MEPFLNGALAGYGIAIPVGAIALLILETGLRRGFWFAFAAGSGAATADLIYATIAATLGAVVALALEPVAPFLRWASALFLVGLGAWGLWKTRIRMRAGMTAAATPEAGGGQLFQTYAMLLGLTLLNPATVAYFAALILGLQAGAPATLTSKLEFVLGAFLASWSWQSLLAAVGALAHRHLPAGFRLGSVIVGNLIIMALGVRIVW